MNPSISTNEVQEISLPHFEAAEDPAANQLLWAVQRLSQMQGGRLEPLRLKTGVDESLKRGSPFAALGALCRYLEKPAPKRLKRPDRAHAPMLACHPQAGWGVLVDRAPDGRWALMTQQGPVPVPEDELRDLCFVANLGIKVNLGFGLFVKRR